MRTHKAPNLHLSLVLALVQGDVDN